MEIYQKKTNWRIRGTLNVGNEDIFPGRILKFGRHFERVEEKVQFLHADPGHLHACAHVRMADIFLKIDFWVQHIGTSPQVKMEFRYGLHSWLWLLSPTYPWPRRQENRRI